MAKVPKAVAAYQQARGQRVSKGVTYFSYSGTNLMGLEIEDIFSAASERDLRDKLAKQFIKVHTVTEISQRVYQIRFEQKRNTVVDTSHKIALEKEALRQKQLDEGTVDADEELEHFMDRFKKCIDKKKGQ